MCSGLSGAQTTPPNTVMDGSAAGFTARPDGKISLVESFLTKSPR